MIIYRDTTSPASPRWPAWLLGAANRLRREAEQGALYGIGEPLVFPTGAGLRWLDLEDGWQVALAGPLDLVPLQRQRSDLPSLRVPDSLRRSWLVPAVLSPSGAPALPIPLACVAGQWARQPTPEQEGLLQAAQAARIEIESGRLAAAPLAAVAAWACTLLAATYHLPPSAIGALALLDDVLITRVLLASAGFPPPEA